MQPPVEKIPKRAQKVGIVKQLTTLESGRVMSAQGQVETTIGRRVIKEKLP